MNEYFCCRSVLSSESCIISPHPQSLEAKSVRFPRALNRKIQQASHGTLREQRYMPLLLNTPNHPRPPHVPTCPTISAARCKSASGEVSLLQAILLSMRCEAISASCPSISPAAGASSCPAPERRSSSRSRSSNRPASPAAEEEREASPARYSSAAPYAKPSRARCAYHPVGPKLASRQCSAWLSSSARVNERRSSGRGVGMEEGRREEREVSSEEGDSAPGNVGEAAGRGSDECSARAFSRRSRLSSVSSYLDPPRSTTAARD